MSGVAGGGLGHVLGLRWWGPRREVKPEPRPRPTDRERVDFIEEFIQTGLIDTAVEFDGGINVRFCPLGKPVLELRYRNNFREAMDEIMEQVRENKRRDGGSDGAE